MANQGQGGSDFAHNFLRTVAKFTEEAGAAKASNKSARLGLIDYEYDPTDFLGGINPRIIFDGETLVSQKRYAVMPPYYPIPGQRVCLIPVGTTYLIIGSVDVVPQDPKVDIFTVTDTWEKPAGARMVRVQVQAGGGAGGGVVASPASDVCAGGGGAGGAYGETWFSANTLDASYTVTVGTGGTGGTGTGGNGTTSSFGSLVSASGGPGGGTTGTAPSNAGVSGATAASEVITADLAINGSGGVAGMRVPTGVSMGGAGGSSHLGGGGRGVAAAGALVAGTPAAGYGGGGGGAVSGTSNNAAANGGDGSPGVIIVTTYF